jgi:hypothetical protein
MEVITKMRSIARRIARLEALSPGFQPGRGVGGGLAGNFIPPCISDSGTSAACLKVTRASAT